MALSAALLLLTQAAPAAPPRPIASALATASVEVLRAERGGEPDRPDAMVRQIRRVAGGMLVEFN